MFTYSNEYPDHYFSDSLDNMLERQLAEHEALDREEAEHFGIEKALTGKSSALILHEIHLNIMNYNRVWAEIARLFA